MSVDQLLVHRNALLSVRWAPFAGQIRPLKSFALMVGDGVRLQYRPYREYCVLMVFGLSRAIASTGNGLDDFCFPGGGLYWPGLNAWSQRAVGRRWIKVPRE